MTAFSEKVYKICKRIPKGRVSTYREIGNALGGYGQVYRAVGVALKNNPYSPIVPCHRIVCSDGRIGGYKGAKSGKKIAQKIALLKKEGVIVKKGRIVNFEKKLYRFC
ncbi:MAG: MGMT family protein [Candidatus Woesearchaeota archaeon]